MSGNWRLRPVGYMVIGALLVLAIQLAGGLARPFSGPAAAGPSISLAAHNLAAARVRATLHAPVGNTHGIKIFQFGLIPSGLAQKFPRATGVVTINGGNPDVSLYDTITVDVANMPPNVTFTIFFIELRVSLASINRFLFRLKAVPASTCQYAVRIVNLRSRLLIRKPPPLFNSRLRRVSWQSR